MDLDLRGKVAVVTGASKGIGLAVVRELAAEGADVTAGARSVGTLAGLDGVTAVEVDLGRPGGPESLVRQAVERHGRLDVLVNNVSPGPVETDLWLGDQGVAATIGAAQDVDPAAVREQVMAGIASGRFSTPEEVATLVTVLASPRTANVTGANFVIDGGLVKTI